MGAPFLGETCKLAAWFLDRYGEREGRRCPVPARRVPWLRPRANAMDLGIKGLRVLVTAGGAGIGLEISRAFVREGAKVHICDVDKKALAGVRKSDPQLTQTVCDVADRKQVAALFEDALKVLGGLDCLVNNAGIAGPTGR